MPPKEDWLTSKVEIKEIEPKGKGLFAIGKINKGEQVIIWGGNYVGKDIADKAREEGKLVMQFDDNLFSIEVRGESDTYFLNHSCNPNVWMENAYTLEAMKDIEEGEELTADYAMWEMDENKISKWECHCGSNNCRKVITGKDWMLKELQEKYFGHFLPLIQKRIELIKKPDY